MNIYKLMIYGFFILLILCIVVPIFKLIVTKSKIKGLADNSLEMTPKEFFKMRNASLGGKGKKHISTSQDFVGVSK